MPIVKEGRERKRGASWGWLAVILPAAAPVCLAAFSFVQPLDFQLGGMAMMMDGRQLPSGSGVYPVWGTLDSPPLKNFNWPVGNHTYQLQGIGHLRSLTVGQWCLVIGWCRGRRIQ